MCDYLGNVKKKSHISIAVKRCLVSWPTWLCTASAALNFKITLNISRQYASSVPMKIIDLTLLSLFAWHSINNRVRRNHLHFPFKYFIIFNNMIDITFLLLREFTYLLRSLKSIRSRFIMSINVRWVFKFNYYFSSFFWNVRAFCKHFKWIISHRCGMGNDRNYAERQTTLAVCSTCDLYIDIEALVFRFWGFQFQIIWYTVCVISVRT